MIRAAIMPITAAILTACSTPPMTPKAPPAVVAELAPTGKLRAVINLGNPVLAGKDAATGEPRGVSVDLSRELAKRLGTPLELVTVTTAAKSVEAIKSGACDVGVRLLDGRFMVINQAMALAKGRPAGARYLAAFVEDMKASGFVAGALARHGIAGAAVAPAAGGS